MVTKTNAPNYNYNHTKSCNISNPHEVNPNQIERERGKLKEQNYYISTTYIIAKDSEVRYTMQKRE